MPLSDSEPQKYTPHRSQARQDYEDAVSITIYRIASTIHHAAALRERRVDLLFGDHPWLASPR